ncbi:hypothetical protein BVX98_02485, partial [bacterium F11]
PVGAATKGQIQVVIDLGNNIHIEQKENMGPNAGAGVFGIGILVLPNPNGLKTIETSSFSQGCGLGGIGALLVKGQIEGKGVRFTQGTGVYGLGIFQGQGSHKSTYWAERNGQGLGMTKGVGLFSHQGDDSSIKGGLVQPDPREPMGSVSLCQGVGFGRRAYVGGGVGIAVVKGDRNTVKGSYFSQGCGYWHSVGVFRYRGHHSLLQARRYDLGSGVHSAFGHFQMFGDHNRILNWGVGPAYGWDNSLGSSLVDGSDNEFQASWGTGMASINSWSFSYWQGNRNKLLLPSFGEGRYYRRRLSYSVQILDGDDNLIQLGKKPLEPKKPIRIMATPWGTFSASDLKFDPDLKLEPPVWEKQPQEKALNRERVDLQKKIKQSQEKIPLNKIGDLVDVTGAFSLDKKSPREALGLLLDLENKDIASLVNNVEPAAMEQEIKHRII